MEQLTQQALEFDKVKTYLSRLTYSALGKAHIQALIPIADPSQIESWLSEVSEVKEIRALHGHLPLEGVEDIREIVSRVRIEGVALAPLELRQIYETLRLGRALKKYIAAIDPPVYPRMLAKVERITLLDKLEAAIRQAIDEEGEVLDSASPALKRIRRELRQAREKIQTWLQNFLQRQTYQSIIQDQVITLRRNRYVIPVKASSRGKIKGIVHDQSSSGVTVFIEPLETVELNNYIASLEAEELQEIQRILLELSTLVREDLLTIEENFIMIGEIDFINAKARLSEKWGCTQPKLCRERALTLRQARHPLLLIQHEHAPEQVVPIDLQLGKDATTLLITGPNTGGKTVSLKTIGLLTLMAQAGVHIPVATDSELCVFEAVYADIGDQQSIEQSLSTFSSHISHIVKILKSVNQRSLVLLDELGAGTDPAEGASLGVAILEHLDGVHATCIATTHHDALKTYAYTHPRTLNACVEFDVNTLSPTYHLMFGLPGKSNAFIIAERLGVPAHIIQRSRELIGEDFLKVDHLIQKLTSDSEEISRKKQEADARYRGVLRLEKETDRLFTMAEQERQEVRNSALEEAKQIVEQAIQQAQQVLHTLPAISREEGKTQVKTLHRQAATIRQKLKKVKKPVLPVTAEPVSAELAVGGKVRLSGLNQTGTVLSLSKDGKQAELQVGAMRIDMPVNQLAPIQSSSPSQKVSVSDRSHTTFHEEMVGTELVIVGKRIEDALDEVSKYLDNAFLAGLSSVSIVHGMGTGRLKKAVATFLRSHPHVIRYALDEQNYGMTNVELARK